MRQDPGLHGVEAERWDRAFERLRATVQSQQAVARAGRRRALSAAAGALVFVALSPLAIAGRGDPLRESVRNGTTRSETEIVGRFNASTRSKGGYVTRQSNTQTGARAGGGAVYGCRGAPGGTEAGSAPCVRANNLAGGRAFEFASRSGPVGLFSVGNPSQASTEAPFATNARGMVGNLNAELLGGSTREQIIAAASGTGGPPTGPAGGSLTGSYPSPTIAQGVVGTGEIDQSQVQRRVSGTCPASSAVRQVAQDGSVTCQETVDRASAGNTGAVSARVYSYFVNLGDAVANTYNMGQVEFRDLGVPGQFQVCRTLAFQVPWVAYLNGVRTSGFGLCTAVQDVPNAQSDFEGTMRRTRWWSAHSGDSETVRSFNLFAISQL